MFLRPCFLVVDREFAGSISSRKLVIETAKFNVITAYSFAEARATLERFPRIHGAVVTLDHDEQAAEFLRWMRTSYSHVKTVATGAGDLAEGLADRHIEGYAPDKLLGVLRDLFPSETRTTEEIERRLEIEAGER